MANELLDFVMGLVRDPDAAARYAADPAQAIADAHLADVTSADVNNLIPMVSDSLSMAAPSFGADAGLDQVVDSNVWTSGAAMDAFDAFAPPTPAGFDDLGSVIDTAGPDSAPDSADLATAVEPWVTDPSTLVSAVDVPAVDVGEPSLWEHSAPDAQPLDPGHTAFDLFD